MQNFGDYWECRCGDHEVIFGNGLVSGESRQRDEHVKERFYPKAKGRQGGRERGQKLKSGEQRTEKSIAIHELRKTRQGPGSECPAGPGRGYTSQPNKSESFKV